MRIDKAFRIIMVFWALGNLKREGEIHSIFNISAKLKFKISHLTIPLILDELEKWGAITCTYPKGSRAGRSMTYKLNPKKIPDAVFKVKFDSGTVSRWKQACQKAGLVEARGGKYYLNARGILNADDKAVGEALITGSQELANATAEHNNVENNIVVDAEWMIEALDGQLLNFDDQIFPFLQKLLGWLCET